MTDREEAAVAMIYRLVSAVVASPTRIGNEPNVATAIDAALMTAAQLRGMPLDGWPDDVMRAKLVAFWRGDS